MNTLICRSKKTLNRIINQLMRNNPYILMFLLMVVMPLMALLAVSVSTIVIMLPISLLLGWI